MTTLFRFPFAALRGLLFGLLLGLPALPAWATFEVDISNPALIRDKATDLTWDRCAWGWKWNNGDTSCERDNSIAADTFDWEAALQAVVAANAASHLDHNDWRLPNIKELESLVDISIFNPAIDTTVFPGPYNTNYYFWSSTSDSDVARAWFGGFDHGFTGVHAKASTYPRVRLVRGGQSFDLLMPPPPPPPPANVAAIPTLGEWATLLLAGLGMAAGWMALRRPRRS